MPRFDAHFPLVTVALPMGMNDASARPSPVTNFNAPRTISGVRARPASILIVDDDVHITQALGELLSDEFAVRTTSSPLEALQWLVSGVWYDVILSDVMMPGMTGVELHAQIDAVRPELSARMVFMTGGVADQRTRDRLDALPNLVLEKPVDVGDLRELIRRRVAVESRSRFLRAR